MARKQNRSSFFCSSTSEAYNIHVMFDSLKQMLQRVVTVLTEHLQHVITVQYTVVGVA